MQNISIRKLRPWRLVPGPRQLATDLLAGLQGAVSSVPGGMAAAVLAGVNPIQGLFACIAGPIAGGLTARTRLMIITTTGAVALAAGSALHAVAPVHRPAAVSLIAVLVAAALLLAGLLRLGRYTRFVTHSVMMGFLTGISVNIVCGQIAGLTGAKAHGHVPVQEALSVLLHPGRIDLASAATGLGALIILAVLGRTRIAPAAMLLAVVLPTVVAGVSAASVARVKNTSRIQPGIPAPALPDFHLLSYGMIGGALAVAVIIVVQGAGVSEAARGQEPGAPPVNGDVIAQGVANLAAGLLRGIPVGGSLGQTALNVKSGARTRLAAVAAGAWMAVILAAFSGAVGEVAVPTLAAVLIYFGISSLQPGEIRTILRTGPSSQVAIVATFTATLLLPVAAAVAIGVALALLQQLNRDALDLTVVELIPLPDGRLAECGPPDRLPDRKVTILDVYGSLLYAGSRTLQVQLPEPAEQAVLVLRLRGRTSLGATFVKVICDYADQLGAAGGRMYLSGLADDLIQWLRGTGRVGGPLQLAGASPVLGESTYTAYLDAATWLTAGSGPESEDGDRVDRRAGPQREPKRGNHAQE
jgi:sulfate permease, SulP family